MSKALGYLPGGSDEITLSFMTVVRQLLFLMGVVFLSFLISRHCVIFMSLSQSFRYPSSPILLPTMVPIYLPLMAPGFQPLSCSRISSNDICLSSAFLLANYTNKGDAGSAPRPRRYRSPPAPRPAPPLSLGDARPASGRSRPRTGSYLWSPSLNALRCPRSKRKVSPLRP